MTSASSPTRSSSPWAAIALAVLTALTNAGQWWVNDRAAAREAYAHESGHVRENQYLLKWAQAESARAECEARR